MPRGLRPSSRKQRNENVRKLRPRNLSSSYNDSSSSTEENSSSNLSNPSNSDSGSQRSIRLKRYTNEDDYAILDYIISNNLIKHVKDESTWQALANSGVTERSAQGLKLRFFRVIVHHVPEILNCTPGGRKKYSDLNTVEKINTELLAFKVACFPKSPKPYTPLATRDVDRLIGDASIHSIAEVKSSTSKSKSKPKSPIGLVDYEESWVDMQANSGYVPQTPVTRTAPALSQRSALSTPSGRRKRRLPLRLRQREHDDDCRDDDDVVIVRVHTPESSSLCPRNTRPLLHSSPRSRRRRLFQEDDEEYFSADSSITPKKRKRLRVSFEDEQTDAVADKGPNVTKGSSGGGSSSITQKGVDIIPGTFPEAYDLSQGHAIFSQRLSDSSNTDASLRCPLLDQRPPISNEVLLSRSVSFARKLDAFAREHHLSATDAATILHASSGRFDVASKFLKNPDKNRLWSPRDDTHLLSTSAADVSTLLSKFGQAEVSERLLYLSDNALFS